MVLPLTGDSPSPAFAPPAAADDGAPNEEDMFVDPDDTRFINFFRLAEADLEDPDGEVEYDKLSLLACNREGIVVSELMRRTVEHFHSPNRPIAEAKILCQTHEKRRRRKFQRVEAQRKSIVLSLFRRATALSPEKQRHLLSFSPPATLKPASPGFKDSEGDPGSSFQAPELHLPDRAQGKGEAASVEAADASTGGEWEDHGKSVEAALMQASKDLGRLGSGPVVRRGNEDEMEILRRRELRMVENEIQQQIDQKLLNDRLKVREQNRLENNYVANQIRRMQNQLKQEQSDQRIAAMRKRNAEAQLEKERAFAARERALKQRNIARALEMEDEAERKAEELAEKLAVAQARYNGVQHRIKLKSEIIKHEVESKQKVSDQRRAHRRMEGEMQLELQKIKTLSKHMLAKRKREALDEEEASWKQGFHQRHDRAQDRIEELEMIHQHELEEKHSKLRLLAERRVERLAEQDEKKIARQLEIQEKEENRSVVVADRQQERANFHTLQNISKFIRHQNWVDNKKRIDRQQEYRHVVKEARMENDLERTQQFLKEKENATQRRTAKARHAAMRRERLLTEIRQLREASDPHAFLKQSRELGGMEEPGRAASVPLQSANTTLPKSSASESFSVSRSVVPAPQSPLTQLSLGPFGRPLADSRKSSTEGGTSTVVGLSSRPRSAASATSSQGRNSRGGSAPRPQRPLSPIQAPSQAMAQQTTPGPAFDRPPLGGRKREPHHFLLYLDPQHRQGKNLNNEVLKDLMRKKREKEAREWEYLSGGEEGESQDEELLRELQEHEEALAEARRLREEAERELAELNEGMSRDEDLLEQTLEEGQSPTAPSPLSPLGDEKAEGGGGGEEEEEEEDPELGLLAAELAAEMIGEGGQPPDAGEHDGAGAGGGPKVGLDLD